MSKGQSPFDTPFSNNTLSNINVSSEESASETDLITFIKGSAGNGKRLYVDTTLNYNPYQATLTTQRVDLTGTQSQLKLWEQLASPTNFWTLFTNFLAVFILAYNGTTTLAITTIGETQISGTGASLILSSITASSTSFFRTIVSGATATPTYFLQPSISGVITAMYSFSYNGFLTLGSTTLSSGVGIRMYDRTSASNTYWDTFPTGETLYFTYNGVTKMSISLAGALSVSGTGASLVLNDRDGTGLFNIFNTGAEINFFSGDTGGTPMVLSSTGILSVAGTSACLELVDRDGSGVWTTYNNLAILRWYNGSDRMTLTTAGILQVDAQVQCPQFRVSSVYNIGIALVGANLVAQNSATAFGTSVYCEIRSSGNTWIAISDRRLKYDITPLESSLDKILALNPVRYKWKSSNTPALGFIAQEVNLVIPELATLPDDPDALLGVDITNMTAFLVKAIQEQQTIINGLLQRIELLENKNNS